MYTGPGQAGGWVYLELNKSAINSDLIYVCVGFATYCDLCFVFLCLRYYILSFFSMLEMVSLHDLEHHKLNNQVQFSAFFNKKLQNWMMIYPLYLNSKKSISKGRLIPLSKCVDNPTTKEIAKVLSSGGFHIMLEEKKVHPLEPSRDCLFVGRVRVQFWKDGPDRESIYPEFSNRKVFLIFIAEQISKLENRLKMYNQPQTISKLHENDAKYSHSKLKKSKKRC